MSLLGMEYQPFGVSSSLAETSLTSGEREFLTKLKKYLLVGAPVSFAALSLICGELEALVPPAASRQPQIPDTRIICVVEDPTLVTETGEKPVGSFEIHHSEITSDKLEVGCANEVENWEAADKTSKWAEGLDYSEVR